MRWHAYIATAMSEIAAWIKRFPKRYLIGKLLIDLRQPLKSAHRRINDRFVNRDFPGRTTRNGETQFKARHPAALKRRPLRRRPSTQHAKNRSPIRRFLIRIEKGGSYTLYRQSIVALFTIGRPACRWLSNLSLPDVCSAMYLWVSTYNTGSWVWGASCPQYSRMGWTIVA